MSNTGSKKIVHEFTDQSGKIVKMTDKVVILPYILGCFWNYLYYFIEKESRFTFFNGCKWVNKGDILFEIEVNENDYHSFISYAKEQLSIKEREHYKIPIRSPVSGFVFGFMYPYNEDSEDNFFPEKFSIDDTSPKILIPEYEVIPENAGLMYAEFCEFCLSHKEFFLKSKYYSSIGEERWVLPNIGTKRDIGITI